MSDDTKKLAGRPFQKGVSGNPGGQLKGAKRLARAAMDAREYVAKDGKTYTGVEAMMHVLIDIAFDEKAKDRERVAAVKEALDRGIGKPQTTVDLRGDLVVGERPASLPTLTTEQLEVLALLDMADGVTEH